MEDEIKKNTGQAGSPFDPYNFLEIEKIQLDIERDLGAYEFAEPIESAKPIEEQELNDAIPSLPNLTDLPSPVSHTDDDFAITIPETDSTIDSFYTETIKQNASNLPKQFKRYRRLVAALLIVCTLGTGTLGVGVGFGIVFLQQRTGISDQLSGNNLQDDTAAQAVGSSRLVFGNDGGSLQEGSLADVVRLVDPAVVRITPVFQNRPPLPFVGGDDALRQHDGSGIIFSVDGEQVFIVTNNHVIQGADGVNISIMEQDPIPASLVGRNVIVDLAVVSVNLSDVHRLGIREVSVAVFGDSDAMQVGDVVLAIGNAMGEGNSTTSGIISAGEKEIVDRERTLRVLQTDAAINPGNSGGPLVNKQGQVIGINTISIASEHYAIEGMGFSIPSNVAKPIIEEIMNQTPRPFLGIEGGNLREDIAAQMGIPPIGIYVSGIIQDTGAERAGIRRGDIITSFNGRAVFNMQQLVEEISRTGVGDTVEVMIIREGREHLTIQVTLGENNHDNF